MSAQAILEADLYDGPDTRPVYEVIELHRSFNGDETETDLGWGGYTDYTEAQDKADQLNANHGGGSTAFRVVLAEE
ncbi:hypothetical protein [Herbiconiux sp. YIM B11900]|uniref:hypothetical protein n=1 Tax=Herbiconiux sp. YIM B11900 TaxID=3404131 RepID=UPI003F83A423